MRGNDRSFGGFINLNSLKILEAPQSFIQSGGVSSNYLLECYPNCSLLGFDYSQNSNHIHSNNGFSSTRPNP